MLVLVDGNVGNSQRQDKYNGSCYFSVGCYGYIFRKGISYNLHQKKWYISATLLLCIITSFRGAGEENKGCARHGFREKEMKRSFTKTKLAIAILFLGLSLVVVCSCGDKQVNKALDRLEEAIEEGDEKEATKALLKLERYRQDGRMSKSQKKRYNNIVDEMMDDEYDDLFD